MSNDRAGIPGALSARPVQLLRPDRGEQTYSRGDREEYDTCASAPSDYEVSQALVSWRALDRADSTAIYRDHGSGDEGRCWRQQEGRGTTELLGLAISAQRDALRHSGAHVVGITT